MNRSSKGLSIQITGVILIVVGVICLNIITRVIFEVRNDYLLPVGSYILSLGLAAGGVSLYNKGRRLRIPSVEEILAKKIPYVLYLRPFESQTDTNRPPGDDITDALALQLPLIPFSSEEEKLAKAMRIIGPGLTIGRPDEKSFPLGFIRLYVATHDDWKKKVEELMADARLVILRLGNTPGLIWELEKAREVLTPERIVLLLPKESSLVRGPGERDIGLQLSPRGPYGAREKDELRPGLTVPVLRLTSIKVKYSVAGIVYFDSDWVGHARPLSDFVINFTHAIDKAFKPVYKRLGVRKGIRVYQIMAILFVIVLVGFIFLANYFGK